MNNESYKFVPEAVRVCFQTIEFEDIMTFYWGQKLMNRDVDNRKFKPVVRKWFSKQGSEEVFKSWLFHCFGIEWTDEIKKNPVVQSSLNMQKEIERAVRYKAN
jgi:hypothetical protein